MRIGVYDSGIGGLSTLSKLISTFPDCDYLYYADNLNFPFGKKDQSLLKANIISKINFLKKETDLIVLACYTASSIIGDKINLVFPIKPCNLDDNNTLLIATPNTIKNVKHICLTANTPSLAYLVQTTFITNSNYKELSDYLYSALNCYYGINTVSIGCTHYNFVKSEIDKIICPKQILNGNDDLIFRITPFIKPSYRRGMVSFCFSGADETKNYLRLLKHLINYNNQNMQNLMH